MSTWAGYPSASNAASSGLRGDRETPPPGSRSYSTITERRRHPGDGVDVSVSMMPWNYTNTTGNFRRLAESISSPRLRSCGRGSRG